MGEDQRGANRSYPDFQSGRSCPYIYTPGEEHMTWLLSKVIYYAGKTAAPTVNDDINSGYIVSNVWIDETHDKAYQCLDNTAGSAVWSEIGVASGAEADHIHDARYYTETELGATSTGHTSGADLIGIPIVAGATNTSLHELSNAFSSAGRFTGGAISDAGSETVNVTAGTGWIKATDDDTAELLAFDWALSNGIAIPTDTTRYIGVVYGTPPVVDIRTSDNYDLDTEFILGSVINVGGTLHILNNPWWVTDGITNMLERFRAEGNLVRDKHLGGLILSVTATRRVVVSSGTLWAYVNEFPITAFTSVADAATFENYYVDALGVWRDADLYQYRVDKWNDTSQTGTAALADLGNNKYCNLWVYVEADDDEIAILYGQAQYVSAAGAEAEAPPTNVSSHHTEHSMLIGRIIIKQGVDTPVSVQSAFDTQFTASQAADHLNLSNIGTNAHTVIDTHISNTILEQQVFS